MGASDAELAQLAGPLRVLTIDQLRDDGRLSRDAIGHRVDQGRLQRLCAGVYLVGATDPEALSLARAATLATGACVSSDWGAFVHTFAAPPPLPVDVLRASGSRRGRKGFVVVHRSTILRPRDLGTIGEIPVTSGARTLLDCAATATLARVEELVSEARKVRAVTPEELDEILGRAGRHPGKAKLRFVIRDSPGITLSEAERILRRLLRDAGIEQPITNHPIGPYCADFAWPRCLLIVEFDSYTHHSGRPAFHHDRERNAWLTSKGWSILPVTWEHLIERPMATAAQIASALAVRDAA